MKYILFFQDSLNLLLINENIEIGILFNDPIVISFCLIEEK